MWHEALHGQDGMTMSWRRIDPRRWWGLLDEQLRFDAKAVMVLGLAAALLFGLEAYRAHRLQAARTAEQVQLLIGLDALRVPAVTQLVVDWRLSYPVPSEDRLSELRDLSRQLHADPHALTAPPAASSGRSAGASPAAAGQSRIPFAPQFRGGAAQTSPAQSRPEPPR